MRKLVAGLVCAFVASTFAADDAAGVEKPKFDVYGFVKGDAYYASAGVLSFGRPSLVAMNQATGSDTAATSFTAQHSRFGLKGTGKAGDIAMGGQIEADFYSNAANSSGKARLRLAYAWCKPLAGLDMRFGQQWDVFSPLNPSTVNTGANLWYQGNLGARRAQMQARYGTDLGVVKPNAQFSIGEATSENDLAGQFIGADNFSMRPLTQGRIGIGFCGAMEVGFSGAYAAYGVDGDSTTQGISVDADLPLIEKYLAVKGEFATGTNMNNAGLLSFGGNRGSADVDINAYWVNAISKPYPFFNVVVGFGNESITSTVANNAPESNMTFYGDLLFPIGPYFTFSAEYQYLSTSLKNVSDANTVNVVDVAGTVNF